MTRNRAATFIRRNTKSTIGSKHPLGVTFYCNVRLSCDASFDTNIGNRVKNEVVVTSRSRSIATFSKRSSSSDVRFDTTSFRRDVATREFKHMGSDDEIGWFYGFIFNSGKRSGTWRRRRDESRRLQMQNWNRYYKRTVSGARLLKLSKSMYKIWGGVQPLHSIIPRGCSTNYTPCNLYGQFRCKRLIIFRHRSCEKINSFWEGERIVRSRILESGINDT